VLTRFLARQFARPSGLAGRYLIAPWLDRIGGTMNRLALEQLDLQPGERVLEIGFGGGGLLAMMLKKGPSQLFGLDVSTEIVARGRRRFHAEVAAARLVLSKGSAERLPLETAAVDKAASLNSLYFWPDLPAAFAELARVVRPGGTLLLAFEPPEELRKWPGHRHGFRVLEVAQVRALMEEAGFGALREIWGTGSKPDLFCCLSGTRIGANG
jgi:ubiquinone/menaquinone biosynthesis C-methylase UbiE